MARAGGGAFSVDLEALQDLAESMDQFGPRTEERVVALHSTVEGIPMQGAVKREAVGWADRWCGRTDEGLAALHDIHQWAALAHANYKQAGDANVALWAT